MTLTKLATLAVVVSLFSSAALADDVPIACPNGMTVGSSTLAPFPPDTPRDRVMKQPLLAYFDVSVRCSMPSNVTGCPVGSSRNPNDSRTCLLPAPPACPSGTVLVHRVNARAPECVVPSNMTACPQGMSLKIVPPVAPGDIARQVCTAPMCPAGTAYNRTVGMCVVAPLITCPTGAAIEGNFCVTQLVVCPAGSSNSTLHPGYCKLAPPPTCPTGSVLKIGGNANECVTDPSFACPSGTTMPPESSRVCFASAFCPPGYVMKSHSVMAVMPRPLCHNDKPGVFSTGSGRQ